MSGRTNDVSFIERTYQSRRNKILNKDPRVGTRTRRSVRSSIHLWVKGNNLRKHELCLSIQRYKTGLGNNSNIQTQSSPLTIPPLLLPPYYESRFGKILYPPISLGCPLSYHRSYLSNRPWTLLEDLVSPLRSFSANPKGL